jgi:hypothetical protein
MRKGSLWIVLFMSLLLLSQLPAGAADFQDAQDITVWKKQFPLILETDFFCSFFILETEPAARIIADSKTGERMLIREGDEVTIDFGASSGAEVSQAFIMIEKGPKIGSFGNLFSMKGWLRITKVMQDRARAKIERLCGDAKLGTWLIPHVAQDKLMGKDMGYETEFEELQGPEGRFLYFQQDYVQLSQGHWALIDLGVEDGVSVGHQLAVYRLDEKSSPEVIANAIVVRAGSRTATVKILSCLDVIKIDDRIKGRI